ncbi:hypothetical protein INT47_009241 [Mucor saturninus]|uniref:Reverse transcriptase RNase H-like domain-containing protein n=1 Tax=Mucor saturninus TaxID=64648 RepID=A0A8H7QHR1_9FUNG|nr:hypothetical protein INT47_009241 [Mucor saturninus]
MAAAITVYLICLPHHLRLVIIMKLLLAAIYHPSTIIANSASVNLIIQDAMPHNSAPLCPFLSIPYNNTTATTQIAVGPYFQVLFSREAPDPSSINNRTFTHEYSDPFFQCGYYRRFVHNYAALAQPLTRLLKKEVPFTWDEEQERAFRSLQGCLVNPPILAFPDREMVQVLTTDASTRGLGAVLSQAPKDDLAKETVIAFGSRALRGSERNYAATHLEALGLIWGIVRFRHYLAGRKFILRTDHAALVFIVNNAKPSPKLSRWAAALMEYDFVIQHQPGRDNPADALSRLLAPQV